MSKAYREMLNVLLDSKQKRVNKLLLEIIEIKKELSGETKREID